jgi:HK97 family phage portal protein
MGLFDLFRARGVADAAVARAEPALTASAESALHSPRQWSGFVANGPVQAGVRVDERTVIGLPATLQALRVICGVFAMTPLHYYRRGADGRSRADGDALQRLMHDAPNSHQTAFTFRELAMGDLLLAGNFYAYISRDAVGRPVALTRLHPRHVVIAEYFDRAEGTILFFDVTFPDGTRERLPAREIYHVAGMGRDGLKGVNPIDYAREALGGVVATNRHANRFWARGGKVDTVLTAKQRISPEAKDRMRSDWMGLYANPDGNSVAVMDQDVTATFLSQDNSKSQFLETRGFQVVELARIWGVPPHLIFDLSRATFGNIEQQSLEFVIYHLGPHFARFEQAATRRFAAENHYFEHLTDALVRGDLKSRMESYWLQRQMGMVNADELRLRENLSRLPGAAGNEYWRPSNMAIAGTPADPGAGPARDNSED